MKIKDLNIEDDKKQYLKITDFDNIFNVYQDRRGNWVFNLNSTWYFTIDEAALESAPLDCHAFWPLISYKKYQTPRLAWLLMKINNVGVKDVFEMKHPGDVIKYLPKDQVENIVSQMNAFDDYT